MRGCADDGRTNNDEYMHVDSNGFRIMNEWMAPMPKPIERILSRTQKDGEY